MSDMVLVVALGFLLGIRHATDADHVVAITTIVTRQRDVQGAAVTGLLWGVGHTLTVVAVGSAIILFNVAIPYRVGVGMELSVGLMLILLGAFNVAAYANLRPVAWGRVGRARQSVHTCLHSHGDYVHSHPHGDARDVHPHPPDRTPLAAVDRLWGRSRVYGYARPVVVGVVHGLAGSAAVALLVVAVVGEPRWAIAYLLVFGLGTIAGMMLITMSIISAFRLAGGRSEAASRRFGLAFGIASVAFGVSFAYRVWAAAAALPPVH